MNYLIALTRAYKRTTIYIGINAIVSVQKDGEETLVVLNSGRHSEVAVTETPEEIYSLVHNASR